MGKLIRGVAFILAVLSAVAIVAMVIAIAVDVFTRNITGASLPGMVEIAETAMVTAVAFGLAWAGVKGEHVAVTLVTDRFNARFTRLTDIFVWFVVVVYTAWLVYANMMRSIDSWASEEIKFGLVQWPMAPMRWILTVGLIVLCLVALVNLFRSVRGDGPMGFTDEVAATLAAETLHPIPENPEGMKNDQPRGDQS